MPTFENGWICRECWTANREFDGRCYRCHADRPADAGTLTLPVRTEERATQTVAEAAPPGETAPKRVTGLLGGAATSAKPEGHCLRCGHKLRDRANYCTGCGTQVSGAAPPSAGARPDRRPAAPAAKTRDVAVAFAGSARDRMSRPGKWLGERLSRVRGAVEVRRDAVGSLRARVALARPRMPLVAAVLLLGTFTLFALTARALAGLSSGQLVFLVAGAAILSGFASTLAVLAMADARSGVASAGERLRTLDELRHAGRILEAEYAAHRAAVLANLSGLEDAPSATPAPAKVAGARKTGAGARTSPTPAR